jgi:UDP-glucuronate 4-epimerase
MAGGAMRVLATGAAGFVGFHVANALLARGDSVLGFDNLNDYYDPALKRARLAILEQSPGFSFVQGGLEDEKAVRDVFERFKPGRVLHLAAQAGVRYSIENPHAYIQSNIAGFLNILEACRTHGTDRLVYASSSSVYGLNAKLPFSESDKTDSPASLYGATKKAGELMAHAYAHLYGVPSTGLRFFTVYGPWGRPDMSPIIFAKAIFEGRPIDIFNGGAHARDFTYVDDITDGVLRVLDRAPEGGGEGPGLPFKIYNIGNSSPVRLMDFIACLEKAIGKTAVKNYLPMQKGDVAETHADVSSLARDTGFEPATPIEVGVPRFVRWFRDYYRV